jgi:hypothetical protein
MKTFLNLFHVGDDLSQGPSQGLLEDEQQQQRQQQQQQQKESGGGKMWWRGLGPSGLL